MAARPAATVVVVREGGGGVEALLLRRPRRSSFAAGAWVFPGGVVDPGDADPGLAAGSAGPGPERWAARMALADPEVAMALVVAALREAWEETGILLADGPPDPDRLPAARLELLAGTDFATLVRREGVRLATEDVLYVAHWITPEAESRRYDTRFFLARVPAGTECDLQGEELVEARWVRPADAVGEYESGALRLLPPTIHTLRRLAGHATLDELWRALRDVPVPTILPRMVEEAGGVVIEIVED